MQIKIQFHLFYTEPLAIIMLEHHDYYTLAKNLYQLRYYLTKPLPGRLGGYETLAISRERSCIVTGKMFE